MPLTILGGPLAPHGDDAAHPPRAELVRSWASPGAGITPADSAGDESAPTPKQVFIVSVAVLAVYNAIELAVMVFLTFRRYHGLYFYSLLVSGLAIIPYTLGFLMDLLDVTTGGYRWLAVTLITVGWWPMVTGQAVVLWSRLHLIVVGGSRAPVIRWTLWMIIIDVVILHVPTTVFTFGSNGNIHRDAFATGYNVMEKIQMTGFFCQEIVLSSIYITETFKLLQTSLQADTRVMMRQLLAINAVIIAMDLGLLGLEAASFYILETMLKGVVYSIKLKLEFAVLGKLVKFVGGRRAGSDPSAGSWDPRQPSSAGLAPARRRSPADRKQQQRRRYCYAGEHDDMLRDLDDVGEYVDLGRLGGDVTRPSLLSTGAAGPRRSPLGSGRGPRGVWTAGLVGAGADVDEFQLARFEHIEDVVTLGGGAAEGPPGEE